MGIGKRPAVLLRPASDTWAALEAILGPRLPTEPPPGSITVAEFATRRGVSTGQAAATLRKLKDDGVMECVTYRPAGKRDQLAYLMVAK